MKVWALLPLKDLVKAKSRLSGVLAPHERRALAQAMVEDVFVVLSSHPGLQGVLVVSDDPSAEMLAHKYAIDWVSEKQLVCQGLNGAVAAATDFLAARGATEIMVLHGDIPLVQAEDIDALLAEFAARDVDIVISPDLAGTGTNAMLFPIDRRPGFRYGENSCSAHQQAGAALGFRVTLLERPNVGLDVDSPTDLLQLYRALQSGAQATHTAGVLMTAGIERRLAAFSGAGLGSELEGRTRDAL